jgi:molybdopterin-guanine dinucleotide biosynthesis protein A
VPNAGNEIAISCAILSGGASRRFGEDKTLAELNGKPLIRWVYDGVSSHSDDIAIIAKDSGKYSFLSGYARVVQDISEKQCALAGVITALTYAKHDRVFVISADTPLFPFNAIPMMGGFDGVVIPKINGRLFPLCAIYPKSILPILNAAFNEARYKLTDALARMTTTKIPVTKIPYSAFLPFDRYYRSEDVNGFININTREDMLNAKQLLSR